MHANARIATLKFKIAEYKKKLDENYTYYFEWNYPGDIYKMNVELGSLISLIDATDETMIEVRLIRRIERITDDLLEGGYLGTSTNELHNLAHTYRKEVNASLLKLYKQYLEMIKD